jgi:hypothetical protein
MSHGTVNQVAEPTGGFLKELPALKGYRALLLKLGRSNRTSVRREHAEFFSSFGVILLT